MQNIIFAWRQDSRLSRFQNRHRCYSNQMWNLSSTNLVSFMKKFLLIDESLRHRSISLSSSHDSLASISHLLLEQFIDFYHDQFAQIWCLTIFTLATRHVTSTSHSTSLATIAHRFSTHSSRSLIITRDFHSWSLIVTRRSRHDRSSQLDAIVTITHRRSTHSSRSLTITREFHSRSLDVISDRSTSIEVVKNRLIEAREDFKKRVLSRFQTRDLLVRFVSTRYESRHSSILRLRLNIYILQHVSRS